MTERVSVFETVREFKQHKEIFPPKISKNPVDFIRGYIDEHFSQEIKLEELAKIVHISKSHLSAKFKNEVAANFSEYLLNLRIGKAKEFLRDKNIS